MSADEDVGNRGAAADGDAARAPVAERTVEAPDHGARQSSPLVDAEQQRIRAPPAAVDAIAEQYLTARDGTNLRAEAVSETGRAKPWHAVVDAFSEYVWRQYKAADTWAEKHDVRPSSHRFTRQAARDRYGRALGVDRAAAELWGDSVTTVHVVRRARAFGVDGQPQPPADHFDDLLAANRNVYDAYRRHIEEGHGLTYARLSVVEPHQHGYAHVHDGLWVHDPDDVVDASTIEPALEAHVRGVPQAQPSRHDPERALSVEHAPARQSRASDPEGAPPTTALPRELTKLLGGFVPHGRDSSLENGVPPVLQASNGRLRFYALLWARGLRQWRPDQSVFPRLVEASQEWWSALDQSDDGSPSPADLDTDGGSDAEAVGTVETVDADGRAVAFDRPSADDTL
jgi:hypothetical protein